MCRVHGLYVCEGREPRDPTCACPRCGSTSNARSRHGAHNPRQSEVFGTNGARHAGSACTWQCVRGEAMVVVGSDPIRSDQVPDQILSLGVAVVALWCWSHRFYMRSSQVGGLRRLVLCSDNGTGRMSIHPLAVEPSPECRFVCAVALVLPQTRVDSASLVPLRFLQHAGGE